MDKSVLEKIPAGVAVVAVTKNHPASILQEVAEAGIKHIGENRVQEAAHKLAAVGRCGLVWHLLGHLQTNKARQAVGIFDLIESVDSVRLLKVLEEEAARINKVQDILLQLNLAREPQKFGFLQEDYGEALDFLPHCSHLRVRGLMTIAKDTEDTALIREVFRQGRDQFLALKELYPADILSMGMSNDFQIAVEEGATQVRLGRLLFGERDYSIRF